MDDRYEAKRRYVEKIMQENAEVETLTEEQHEALQELARIRHEIHSSWETMWNDEANDNPRLWNYIESGIDGMLPKPSFPLSSLIMSRATFQPQKIITYFSRKRSRQNMITILGSGERKAVLSMSLRTS